MFSAGISKIIEFYRLDQKFLNQFENNWNLLEDCVNFSPKELTYVIANIALKIVNHPDNRTEKEDAIKYMADNFNVWKKRFFQNKDDFEISHFANTLWALAILDSQFPDVDFSNAYNFIRAYISDGADLKTSDAQQIRQADLWFTGATNISRPSRDIVQKTEKKEGLLTISEQPVF